MDIWLVVLIVVAVVLAFLAVGSPQMRRRHEMEESEFRARHDVDRQFKRPPNEGDLL